MHRRVMCESQLERDFFQCLEAIPEVLYYQEQPTQISYVGRGLQRLYHPDALVCLTDGRSFLVEIKPVHYVPTLSDIEKWGALIEEAERQGYGFFIGNHLYSLQHLLSVASDPRLVTELNRAAMRGEVTWPELKEIRGRLGRTRLDMATALLAADVVLVDNPIRARRRSPTERAAIEKVTRWFGAPKERPQRAERTPRKVGAPRRPNVGKRWSVSEEQMLLFEFNNGRNVGEIAELLGRQPKGVKMRLRQLGRAV
jgi:hypothetical protein